MRKLSRYPSKLVQECPPHCSRSGKLLAYLLPWILSACAANPMEILKPATTDSDSDAEQEAAANADSVRIQFHQNSFYSHVDSSPAYSCAGDIKTLYNALDLNDPTSTTNTSSETGYVAGTEDGYTGPIAFPESTQLGETVRPKFIKNISLDITDANAPLTANNAKSCALSEDIVPTSSCATFDFGSIGGIPTSLGGTLILIGGVQGVNYAGVLNSSTEGPDWTGSTALTENPGVTLSCGAIRDPAALPGAVGGDANTGTTQCAQSLFALGVDSIPASSLASQSSAGTSLAPGLDEPPASGENISSWANLVPNSSSSGSEDAPGGRAGASVAYSTGTQKLLVFGGSSILSGFESESTAADTLEAWIYDIKTQTWQKKDPSVTASNAILKLSDFGDTEDSAGVEVTTQLSRSSGSRAYFGYVSVPYSSLKAFGADDGDVDTNERDGSDRIWIIGGAASGIERYMTRKLNPTFGPERVDSLVGSEERMGPESEPASTEPRQWMESFHTQLLSNAWTDSYFRPDYDFDKDGDGVNDTDEPQWFGATRVLTDGNHTGIVVTGGGFDAEVFDHTNLNDNGTAGDPSDDYADVIGKGAFQFSRRYSDRKTAGTFGGNAGSSDDDQNSYAGSFIGIPNLLNGDRVSPIQWAADGEPTNTDKLNWYGAPLMLPGLWMEESEIVYLGGSTCLNFMTDSTLTGCDFANPGKYIQLGTVNSTYEVSTYQNLSFTGAMAGTVPDAAGMTGARGHPIGQTTEPVLVVWGGMEAAADPTDGDIYILHDTDGTGNLTGFTWVRLDASDVDEVSGELPPVLTASQMVYSHVTGKFYIFGGYQGTGTVGSNGDTYELTISGSSGSYTAAWRKLDTNNGMTCTPECPTARRGHGMVEARYTATDFDKQDNFDDQCTAEAPCSFGIFMEGGTSDGSTLLSDRWMFDPTAHGGQGHWARVNDFPPRKLASLASITFESQGGGTKNWAVLFGGESGMDTPEQVQSGKYMVPPTFGDTMIYDFDTHTWNRMRILGKGYKNTIDTTLDVTQLSQEERRQAYSVDTDGTGTFRRPRYFTDDALNELTITSEPTIADLAPPALSGAVFVARTYPRALRNAAGTVTPLKLPELFLIGGRSQTGKPQALKDVWKLCVASPGERIPITVTGTDDASCDHYEDTTNEDSPAPLIEYTGRWIHKEGTEAVGDLAPDAEDRGAYLAAGTYDSQFDRIVIYGGMNAYDGGHVGITSADDRSINDEIFEYTPPSKVNTTTDSQYHGTWSKIPHCLNSDGDGLTNPTPRYGHSISYDPIQKRLIVVGGFDENGSALKQTISIDNPETTYDAPEVWTGTRIVEPGTYFTADHDGDGAPDDVSESNPCYAWRKITVFGNSTEITTALPPQTAIGHAASIYIPPTGYNTGYYSLFDDQCVNQGPFSGGDALVSKQYAGGANIDLDRDELGTRENLLLNLTYLPLGTKNQRPDGQLFSNEETAFFKVHLVSTSESESKLLSALQPRHLWYTNENQFPKIVHTLDVLGSESGTPRTDQIIIPLGIDSSIDRIRIERVSGSAILIDAALFRMGPR